MKKVAVYLRVSTDEQSTENQMSKVQNWAEFKGVKIKSIYQENASGRNDARPERKRLIEQAMKGRYDTVIVWALDRWGRSSADISTSIDEMSSMGITFVSLNPQIDTSTPMGAGVLKILGALADIERTLMAERQRAGIERARAEGKLLGREKRHLDEIRLMELREEGHSIRAIAEMMNAPRSTIADRIKALSEKPPLKRQ